MPEISVIVPNYNTERYLPRCLDSLIKQTFKDIEIFVIDDGSQDNSIQIMENYAKQDPRIKIIKQNHAGVASARNKGLESATGKYIMFCDSDDWYEKNMCEVMYHTIQQQKADVVCCDNFFSWEENLDKNEKNGRLPQKHTPQKSGKESLNSKVILSTNVVLWNKIWRRDLIEKYHIRFPAGCEHDDDTFWYMYSFVAESVFHLPKALYHYFLHAGSIMSTQYHKQPKNRMDRINISDYVMDFATKNNLSKAFEIIPDIYTVQLNCCKHFFNSEELDKLGERATKTINDKLHVDYNIIYASKCFYLLKKKKSYLCLIGENVYNSLFFYFWKIFDTTHAQKYKCRITKNVYMIKRKNTHL